MAPAHPAPTAQAAGGGGSVPIERHATDSQRCAAFCEKISAKSDSTLSHSLPIREADASSRTTKSNPRDDNASRAANSSAPRQMSSGTDATAIHDSNAAHTPALHDQAASSQSSAFQSAALHSAELHSAGFQSVGFQNAGGQAAAAPSPATAMAATAIVPAPPQAPAPASAPRSCRQTQLPGLRPRWTPDSFR